MGELSTISAVDRIAEMTDPALRNLKITQSYHELSSEFARFLESCGKDSHYDTGNIARFCNSLKPGDPPDGQQYIQQAFQRYYQAFFEPNQKKKAEQMLPANIEIGFHEQTRLQPEIAEAMEAAVIDPKEFKAKLLKMLFPNQNDILTALATLFRRLFRMPTPLDRAIEKFTSEARHRIRLFLSAHMMELDFPKGLRLRLGRDLKSSFPLNLQHLTNPDLIAFLKKIDPSPDRAWWTPARLIGPTLRTGFILLRIFFAVTRRLRICCRLLLILPSPSACVHQKSSLM